MNPMVWNPKETWNFAYGGNMNPKVLCQRRGIHPLESIGGLLEDYRLVFNARGFPWLEPVFANIEPAIGESVHGVLHRLTHEQFKQLDQFEGGGIAYRHLELEVKAYDGRKIMARIYSAISVSDEKRPSCRYLEIMREGACYHKLDASYITMLNNHPCENCPRLPDSFLILFEKLLKNSRPVMFLVRAFWYIGNRFSTFMAKSQS